MFSETDLGVFLKMVYAGSYPELMKPESALTLATLLLADISITNNKNLFAELRRILTSLYGDYSIWRCHEDPPSKIIRPSLEQVLNRMGASNHDKAFAYLSGLLGKPQAALIANKKHKLQHIHSRGLRIFYSEQPPLIQRSQHIFVCLVGLKGSGKTSILRLLQKDGKEVLEIYRELDKLQIDDQQSITALPPREEWENEPLQLCLEKRGIYNSMYRTIFIGSLLRRSEVDLLSNHGKVILIHLVSTNALRHARAKKRGREIEKCASQEILVELDAHRDGLWPGYEQNDLGGLVDLCHYRLINEENTSLKHLYRDVKNILEKEAL